MKASNGKRSNLNERNWLLVRTEAFKDWFGDWKTQAKSTYLLEHLPIVELHGTEFAPDDVKLTDKVPAFYKEQYDGKVTRDGIGGVLLDKESVKDSISHGIGRIKSAAFAAVPNIIQDGIIIDSQNNWKERIYDSITIVAPITIAGERYIGVAITERLPNDKNFFYLHEVMLQKNLLNDNIKTDTEAGYHQEDIAKILKNIVSDNSDSSKVVDANGEPLVEDIENLPAGNNDIRYRIYGGNSGYVGYSMSKRAAQAREEGRFRIPESENANRWNVSDELASEMQAIKERAESDGTFMKAPNGKRSNLNERNWLLVRTGAF